MKTRTAPGRWWAVLLVWLALASSSAFAAHQLLPRLPEFVIEKGYSDAFRVDSIAGSADLVNDSARSELTVVLTNVSGRDITTSIKVRVLYLVSGKACHIWVDGKSIRFDRANPRLSINLQADQKVTIKVAAEQEILYNLDAGKPKPVERKSGDDEKSRFSLNDLGRMFNVERDERLGKRYLVGPLVTKWGVFPLEIGAVSLRVKAPHDFAMVPPTQDPSTWKTEDKGGNHKLFTYEGGTGFAGVVFMPEKDRASMPLPVATGAATVRSTK